MQVIVKTNGNGTNAEKYAAALENDKRKKMEEFALIKMNNPDIDKFRNYQFWELYEENPLKNYFVARLGGKQDSLSKGKIWTVTSGWLEKLEYNIKTVNLQDIKNDLNHRTEYIKHLEKNWDGEVAKIIKKDTLNNAIEFVARHIDLIYKNFRATVEYPKITPNVEGDIDILWKNDSYRLLINVPEYPNELVSFYGDDYKEQTVKGLININEVNYGIISILGMKF